MATHEELVGIPFRDGAYRFCLDRVIRDEEEGRVQYAFVWRGTRRSRDGFISKPAYFDLTLLGRTLRQAMREGKVSAEEGKDFLATLAGLSDVVA